VPPVFRSPSSNGRPLRVCLVAVGIVLALALATRALHGWRAASLPTGNAEWIWKPVDRTDHRPTAFYAVRDFDLESPPFRARLLIAADEEYVLTLNGKRIGAGAFVPDAPLDVYEVGPLLLPGGNRLLVELRSGRGTGGLLASLRDEASGRQIVGTDGSWRIFPDHDLGLVRGWLPIGSGEPALRWGLPPVGRWGTPKAGHPRPLLPDETGPPIPAASMLPFALPAGMTGATGMTETAGQPVLYDWGRPVEGFLTLDVPPAKELGMGLLFAGDAPPDPLKERPTAAVLIQPGRHDWTDALPRRFRYALLVGLERPAAAAILPVSAGLAGSAGSVRREPAVRDEVFGIQGPPLRTPVEDEVWSELQRLPGVAGRKKL
jgi:hypothetical protein